MTDIIRKSLAELVGTYIFVLFGSGSIVAFIAAFNQTLNPSTLFYWQRPLVSESSSE